MTDTVQHSNVEGTAHAGAPRPAGSRADAPRADVQHAEASIAAVPVDLLVVSRALEVARVDRIEFSRSGAGRALRVVLACLAAVGIALVAGAVVLTIVEHEATERAIGILLGVTAVVAVVWALIFELLPSRRQDLRVAEVVIRFGLRCVGIATGLGAFIVVGLLVLTRAALPEAWTADEDDLLFSVVAIAITGAVLAALARSRSPLLATETRLAVLGARARPRTAAIVAVLTIAFTVLVPILPGPLDEAPQATTVISTLAAVASIILAAGFAWLSAAVMNSHYDLNAARHLANELLKVAGAARRTRFAALTEGEPSGHREVEITRSQLLDALTRVSNSTKSRVVRQRFTATLADRGVHLALEGALERLGGVPLGPVATRYERSIRGHFDATDDTALLIGLEVFARELAGRARASEASNSAQYARTLQRAAAAAEDDQRRALERAAAARAPAPSSTPTSPLDASRSPEHRRAGPFAGLRRLLRRS